MKPDASVRILGGEDDLAREAAAIFAAVAQDAAGSRGIFAVALAGGSTPRGFYRFLGGTPAWRDRVPWDRTEVFWGDERPVGPAHPESNYGMAREELLRFVAIPEQRVHRIRGELADPAEAARHAEEELRGALAFPDGVPRLDLILLGLGEDGHTASLFPASPALEERARLFVANPVPARQTVRITMTFPLLTLARRVVFLVQGASKAAVVRRVLREHRALVLREHDAGEEAEKKAAEKAEGKKDSAPARHGDEESRSPGILPAARVHPSGGELLWLLDRAAASRLS